MSGPETDRGGASTAALVAFAAALVVYLGAGRVTSFDFVNYDDVYVVARENPAVGKGLAGGLPELLDPARSPQFMNAWLPAYYWSLGLDHALGGGAPWAFHLHSALLHALGAAMATVIARRLGAAAFVAGLAGVIFAVHPVATESVAWVASRKDVLSFVWMAAAAICYLDGVEKRRSALHAAGASCLLVSLTAKGTTLVLPLLLAVHALVLRRDGTPARGRLAPVAPYAAVAAVMTALHLLIAAREGTAGAGGAPAGLGALLVADLEVVWRYAAALLAPVVQSVEHGVTAGAADARQAFLGASVIVAWGVAVAAAWRRSRGAAAVLLCVPIALLPFNNVLPRTSVLFAERYSYVALLPLSIGLAWLLRPRGDGLARHLPAAAGAVVLAALAAARLPVWRDSIALWTDAETKAPSSAFVQCQLADAYGASARGESGERAAELNGRAARAWRSARTLAADDLSRLRAETGLATQLFVTASGSADPRAQIADAVAGFVAAQRHAAKLDVPGIGAQRVQILTNRAACRELLGDGAGALADWTEAVRIDPACARAWDAMARLYLAGGDAAGARRVLADAIAANPADPDFLIGAARLDALWLRPVDAETKLRRAMALRPDDASIRELLAAALLDQAQSQAARDDMDAAREAARKAGEVVPESSAPAQMLGIVARRAGRLDEAAQHLRRARELHAGGARIREQLASVLVELASRMLDAEREAMALILLEEAVQTGADAVSTPRARIDAGVADWPEPGGAGDRAAIARSAALKGLARLACGRAADAAAELTIADAGTRDGDARLRRVVLRLLVRARFATGEADAAVASAEELRSLDVAGDADWAWRREAELASALVERGIARRGGKDADGARADFSNAREVLGSARAAGMPEARHALRRGEILFAEEDFLAATKEFDAAERLAPRDAEPLLDRAAVWRTLFLLEEDEAFLVQREADLRRAAEIAPGDPRVLAALGETLFLQRKPGEAFPWLQKAILADPSQATARGLLADLAVRAGRSRLEKCAGAAAPRVQQELAEARAAAERAVALDPPSPEALIFLGDVLRAQGDWASSLARYAAAADRFPESAAARDAVAKFHVDRGHFQLLWKRRAEAVLDFRAALAVEGTTIDLAAARDRLHEISAAAYAEAIGLDREGRFDDAAERFALSFLAEPTADGHRNCGTALFKAGKFEEALAEFEAALEMAPQMIDARLSRAAALERLGRLDGAVAGYRAWLDAAPPDAADRRRIEKHLEWLAGQMAEIEKEPPK